jgi:hypothetical protein
MADEALTTLEQLLGDLAVAGEAPLPSTTPAAAAIPIATPLAAPEAPPPAEASGGPRTWAAALDRLAGRYVAPAVTHRQARSWSEALRLLAGGAAPTALPAPPSAIPQATAERSPCLSLDDLQASSDFG